MDGRAGGRELWSAILWVVGGLIAGLLSLVYSSKDDLFSLLGGLYFFSVVVVGVATFEMRKVLGQTAMSAALLMATAAIFMNFPVNPVTVVMVGMAVVIGSANAFTDQRLSLLTLLGQLLPVSTTAFVLVTRHEISVPEVALAYLVGLGLCLLGPIVSRSLPRDVDLAELEIAPKPLDDTSFSCSEN